MDSPLCSSYWVALFTVLPTLALLLFIANKRVSRKSSPRSTPPGQFGWPVLGETLELLQAGREGRPGSFLDERVNKHGPCVFATSLFGEPTAVFCGTAGNKFLFGNENRKVRVSWPSSAVKLLGSCIVTLAGDEAKVMRRMLMSVFNHEALARFAKIMDEVTRNHIKANWEGKEEVLVYPTVKHLLFELTCQLFLSIRDPQEIADLAPPFAAFLKGVISVPLDLPGTRFRGAKKAAISIRKMLREIIKKRRVALEDEAASPTQDLLSYLMVTADENGRFLTETEIINNLLLLVVASHNTSSCTITMVIKFLGELPHVYEKVLAEQREIAVEKKSAGEGEGLTREDVQKMRVTWSVVSEAMRLVPPALGGFRVALEDFAFCGYTIPKGWKLIWSPLTTNNDPDIFPNPKQFDAARFAGSTSPAPWAFIPFGGGPRICLGKDYAQLQILILLHHLVNNFKWTNAIPDEKVEFDPMPIPSRGLPIRTRPHQDRP